MSPNPVPGTAQPEQLSDRRVSIRYACDEEALCHLGGAERREPAWARLQDVSTTGVGLRLETSLAVGRRLSLEFPEAASPLRRVLRARVAHCTALGDGTWLVGCSFDRLLADNELAALLGPATDKA